MNYPHPLFALFLLLLVACGDSQPEPTAVDAEARAASVDGRVTTGPLEERTVSHDISCTGTVELPPNELMSVHSRIEGQVSDLQYINGDFVKRGALLMRVSNPQLIEKQRELLEARARLGSARAELDRQNILASGDATTAAALQSSKSSVELLQATYGGLRSELTEYGIDVKSLEEEGNFQSSVGIYASANGYVHEVMTNQGHMVVPTDELMQMADTEHLHLELRVPSREVTAVKLGQEVTFMLPYNEAKGKAIVEKINPMADMETATLGIHCHFERPLPDGIIPGLFVNATISAGERKLTGLPLDAVVKEGQQYYGFRKEGDAYAKTALRDSQDMGDFIAFSNTAEGEWVTGGAYYLGQQGEE